MSPTPTAENTVNREAEEPSLRQARLAVEEAKKHAKAVRDALADLEGAARDERHRKLERAALANESVELAAARVRAAYDRSLRFISSTLDLTTLESASKEAREARERASELRKQAEAARADADAKHSAAYELFVAIQDAPGQRATAEQTQKLKETRKIAEAASLEAERLDKEAKIAADASSERELRVIRLRNIVREQVEREANNARDFQDLLRQANEEVNASQQALQEATTKSEALDEKADAESSICGKGDHGARSTCFFYGLFTAALSRVTIEGEDGTNSSNPFWGGRSARQIGAVAVPTAGARWVPSQFISLDVGAYSALISPRIESTAFSTDTTTETGRSCSTRGGTFEKQLPCQGNARLTPYAAVYAGVTFGKRNLGYVSMMPLTVGLGNLGTSQSLKVYYGWTLGVIQVTGSLP